MPDNHQNLQKFIRGQVNDISEPFAVDKRVHRILDKYKGDSRKEITPSIIDKVFQAVNQKASKHTKEFFSNESIHQVSDQILMVWDDESSKQEELIATIKELHLPIELKSDYKLYSLRDIIEQVESLPQLELNVNEEIEINEPYINYNSRKTEITEKVKKIGQLQQKIKALRSYHDLVNLKIGDRHNIQENIPSSKNNIYDEIAKLRVIIEKFKSLDETKKQMLIELLNQ